MAVVRVKEDVVCIVHHNGVSIPLHQGLPPFDANDPLVREFPWAFQSDTETKAPRRADSVSAEQATAAPGEKRNR
jgi:hypothetical protein